MKIITAECDDCGKLYEYLGPDNYDVEYVEGFASLCVNCIEKKEKERKKIEE